ncbi:sensor histidine kinase [Paenibacillus piri]|uniref:histidine kinase n=1 Tax=Paenibacillus piri TaxID=2547395 RepID=A0A4R5KJ20_9BACL|nr:HAMP domain-containing sensor histidine kinase [Paenibacillus piri]TDF94437.1 HAMP domain-containing histidine kinase [Paenibacillus piri]
MFNKTRTQLVLLNSVVFVLVLLVSGIVLYVHLGYRLYHQADEALLDIARTMQTGSIDQMLRDDHPEPDADRRVSYFFWDEQGQLIAQYPKQSFSLNDALRFKNMSAEGSLLNMSAGGRDYKVLGFRNPMREAVGASPLPHVFDVVAIRSLEAERRMLRTLRTDLALGGAAGLIFSVLAGFYLAGRSLVPIRRSWTKQQQFVADASHELRTPTSVIRTRAELLFRHPQHTIEQESQNIAVIAKESKRMGKLIDDLLTLARTDSNQLQIQAAAIPLHPILEEIAEQFQLLAETKSIRIHSQFQPSIIWGDESRLRQLFVILLDNALKFTPPHGTIEFTCHNLPHSVKIVVKDSGCGIAEADLPHIFERFYRGDKVRSRDEGGTGLGLSIAEWIVHAHKGTIRVASRVSVGTEFQMMFPRKP